MYILSCFLSWVFSRSALLKLILVLYFLIQVLFGLLHWQRNLLPGRQQNKTNKKFLSITTPWLFDIVLPPIYKIELSPVFIIFWAYPHLLLFCFVNLCSQPTFVYFVFINQRYITWLSRQLYIHPSNPKLEQSIRLSKNKNPIIQLYIYIFHMYAHMMIMVTHTFNVRTWELYIGIYTYMER